MTTHDFTFDVFSRPADTAAIAVVRIASATSDDGRLERLARAVRAGVVAAGGVAIEITADGGADATASAGGRAGRMARAILADAIEQALGARRPDGLVCIADGEAGLAAAAMALGRLDLPGLVCGADGVNGLALALAVMGLSPLDRQEGAADGERYGRLAVERVRGEDSARKYVTVRSLGNAAAAVGGGAAAVLHLSAIAAEAGVVFWLDGADDRAGAASPPAPAFAGDAWSAIRRLAASGAIRNAPTVSGRSLFAEASTMGPPAASGIHHLRAMPWGIDDEDRDAPVGPHAVIAARHARGGDIERPHAP